MEGLVDEAQFALSHGVGRFLYVGGKMDASLRVVVVPGQRSGLTEDHPDIVVQLRPEGTDYVRGQGWEGLCLRPQRDVIAVQIDNHTLLAEIIEAVCQAVLVNPAQIRHGGRKHRDEEVGQNRDIRVGPPHGEEEGEKNLAAFRKERQLS